MVNLNFIQGFAFKDPQLEENYQSKNKDYIWYNFFISSIQILLILIFLLIMSFSNNSYHYFRWWPLIFIGFCLVFIIIAKYQKQLIGILSVLNNLISLIGIIEYLLGYDVPEYLIFFLGWAVSHLTYEIFSSLQNIFLKSLLILLTNAYCFIRIGLFYDPLIIILLIFTCGKIVNIIKEEIYKRKIFREYFAQLKNLEYYKYVLDKGIHSGAVVITLNKELVNNSKKDKDSNKSIKNDKTMFESPYINYPAKRLFKLSEDSEIFDILELVKLNNLQTMNSHSNKISQERDEILNNCEEKTTLLSQIISELEKVESMKNNEDLLFSTKSWGETLIKELMSISIKRNSEEINFDLIISKFFWNQRASIILIFNDISDKVIKERLAILNKHKDHLLASVSHDLKTPLNAIFGYTTELLSRKFSPDIKDCLIQIKINSKLLQYQIDNILDYSQLNNNSLKMNYIKFNLLTMLSQISSLVEKNIQLKGLKLSFEIDPSCPKSILSDPHRLKQLLMIIIGNAIKFTFKGKIEIKINKTDNNTIKFEISDTGIGIKEERKKNLFCLFQQESDPKSQELNQHGIGLGLTLSKHLINKLGPCQQINLDSEDGKGSDFSFFIYIDNKKKDKNELNHEITRLGSAQFTINPNRTTLELTPVIQNTFFDRQTSMALAIKRNDKRDESEIVNKLKIINNISNHTDEINEEGVVSRQMPRKSQISNSFNKKPNLYINSFLSRKFSDEENPPNGLSYIKALDIANSYSSLDSTPLIETNCEFNDNQFFNFLIVDDTPLNLLILETFIMAENKKNSVMKVYNGQQAIDIMIANPNLFDIVLMDCNMPVLNGYEATVQLKELMNSNSIEECPILAISAYSKVSEDIKWKECGMDDFIEKPLTKNKFQEIYKIWANKKRVKKTEQI